MSRLRTWPRSMAAVGALLLAGCAQSTVTWRAADEFEPLPADAEVRLFVRTTAPLPLREALIERGAEEVRSFPEGDRVAEIAAREATWVPWDDVVDDVRRRAREMGADMAMGTGAESYGAAEHVLYFQLLRSFGPRRAPPSQE